MTPKEEMVIAMEEAKTDPEDATEIVNELLDNYLVKYGQLMPEFEGVPLAELRLKMNHLAVPLAYRELRIRNA